MIQKRNGAFTLIEAIAAVVLLSVSVPPMLWAVRSAHAGRTGPVQGSRARWLAVEKLEDVIADRHSTTRGYDYLIPTNYPNETQVSGFSNFRRSVTLTETLADLTTPGNGYMTVAVNVSWIDGSGTTRTLTVSTVLTEYQP